ncbi:uncharacterized protein DUF559 [Agromyces ramosus]|uniref:Uncharacterized protein DUF559 n=1 Tax=Agromyces ramosus TaxID=33879 RepID=A0A4Q7ML48_9MICO|nr:uncharacterized protein DUF559 [Agromyces ramosus]
MWVSAPACRATREHAGVTARIPVPPWLDSTPFSLADGRAAGLGDERMRGRDLVRPFRGVRVVASATPDLELRCRAYCVRMRSCEVFSHRTAGALHGLPIRPRDDGRLDVAAFEPHGVPRASGVRGHRVRHCDIRAELVRGLQMVSAVDAWCQLAAELGHRDLVVLGDALVRRSSPIATMDVLAAAVGRRGARRGFRRLVHALRAVRARTDSPAETLLRLDLVEYGLPEPEINVDILDRHGRRIAIGDLVYRDYRVIVEYDGEHHRTDRRQYARDVDRLDDLAREGWRVIRFNAEHVGVRRRERLMRVHEALVAAGWRPGAA